MRLRKTVIVIIIAMTVRLILSCCNCAVTKEYKYTFKTVKTFNLDNSGANPVISETNIVPEKAFGIRLEFIIAQLAYFKQNNFYLFPETRAQDCFCPPEIQFTAKDSISSIIITTINDFDSLHIENTEVTDLFYLYNGDKYISINDYVNQAAKKFEETPEHEILDLFLLISPKNTGSYQFKIDTKLSDNRVFSVITNLVTLN